MGELEVWRRLAAIAAEMAHAASAHDWEALVGHDARFHTLLPALSTLRPAALDEPARSEKAALIGAILTDYEQVRAQVGPWMADVAPLLDAWSAADPETSRETAT
jgi:DNA-binding GntR family transcriptional regulator